MGREDHGIAHLADDGITTVRLTREVPGESFRGDIGFDRRRIHPAASSLQRSLVEVAGKDLDLRRSRERRRVLEQHDGEAVGLLPGRASRRPHADSVVAALALEERRHDVVLQCLEDLDVAKEVRDGDQQIVEEQIDLVGRVAEQLDVRREIVEPVELQPTLHAPSDGRFLVSREIAAGAIADDLEDVAQRRLAVASLVGDEITEDVRVELGQLDQARSNVGHWQGNVDRPGADRAAGHAVVLRISGILGDRQPAVSLDRRQAGRSVGPRSAEDDTDRAAVVHLGERPEEVVDEMASSHHVLHRRQPQVGVDCRQVPVRRDHIDAVRLERYGLGHLQDRYGRMGLEEFCEVALVVRRQVDDHHERHAGLCRKPRHEGP